MRVLTTLLRLVGVEAEPDVDVANASGLDEGVLPNRAGMIEHFTVHVVCRCPCGSQILHQLTLVSTAECPRCGQTIGLRSVTYVRGGPATLPDPQVTVGYVVTAEALGRRDAAGVQ